MNPPSIRQQGWSSETRWCVLVFGLALVLNVRFSLLGLDHTLIGGFSFRQAQTAITAQFFLRDGITLFNYATPLLGPPWEIPLELPLFQASVALFVRLTGLELDVAGRVVSWLYFLSALPACYLLLGRLQVPRPRRLLFLALLLLSPLYLFFSRAFLIESAALSFSCWFLFCFASFLEAPRKRWYLGAAVFGLLAGAIKVTTLAVILIAAFLLVVGALRRAPREKRLRIWSIAAIGVALPVVGSIGWVFYTASVRRLNPETAVLDGHFGYWSFGDLALRISSDYWLRTFRVWADWIVGESGLLLVAMACGWSRTPCRRIIAACLVSFLSGQMIFANLYFVHPYYFYAAGLFLTASVGFGLSEFLDRSDVPNTYRWLFVLAVLGLQLGAYHRGGYLLQQDNRPVPEYVQALREFTDEEDVIVIVGQDWDGVVPYYANRRAFMLMHGTEHNATAVRQRLRRLDRRRIGAVVIEGSMWQEWAFAQDALGELDLGTRPLLADSSRSVGIWVPADRQAHVRDQFIPHRFPSLQITPQENPAGVSRTISSRQIRQIRGFDGFRPLPVRATSINEFSNAIVEGEPVLTANAISELFFRPPPNARTLTGIYGLGANSYAKPDMTDGVEFVISELRSDGTEVVLFRRFLNPAAVQADRGIQTLEVPLPPLSGELVLRTLGGPSGSVAYDWSYWGRIRIE